MTLAASERHCVTRFEWSVSKYEAISRVWRFQHLVERGVHGPAVRDAWAFDRRGRIDRSKVRRELGCEKLSLNKCRCGSRTQNKEGIRWFRSTRRIAHNLRQVNNHSLTYLLRRRVLR